MSTILITFSNSAGVLDTATVDADESDAGAQKIKDAVLQLVDGVAYFSPGDRITINEV